MLKYNHVFQFQILARANNPHYLKSSLTFFESHIVANSASKVSDPSTAEILDINSSDDSKPRRPRLIPQPARMWIKQEGI